MEIKLEPSLSNCIETVAKIEYEKILSQLLRGRQEDTQLAEELELLRMFLESANFSQLRSQFEQLLLNGRQVVARLRSTGDPPKYEIEINEVT